MRIELVALRIGAEVVPDLTSDDFFESFAVPVTDWLGKMLEHDRGADNIALATSLRCQAYAAAYRMYQEAAKSVYGDAGEILRHPPQIVRNYDSLNNSWEYVFIFKAENNGNTYRIKVDPKGTF